MLPSKLLDQQSITGNLTSSAPSEVACEESNENNPKNYLAEL